MGKERAEIGFDNDPLEDFDPKEWSTSKGQGTTTAPKVPKEEIRKVAEQTGFTSREGRRVHRTGRSEQLNLKVRNIDKEAFYELTDQQGWVLGETFQHMLEALQRELDGPRSKASTPSTKG